MQTPPGGGHIPREAQELEARFSALSAEISASLDMIFAKLQRAPGDEHAIAVARDLVAAQQAISQQLLLLSQAGSGSRLPPAHPRQQLPAPAARIAPPGRVPQPRASEVPLEGAHFAQRAERPEARGHASPTLADLLRHHLAASAAEPPSAPLPLRSLAPQPAMPRPHALELAPMMLPASNHVVWTDHQQPQFAGGQAAAANYSEWQTVAADPMPPAHAPVTITTAELAAATQSPLPAWAQAAVQPKTQRYGLWAGGAVAAVVVGLGIMLHAGRHPEAPAPAKAEAAEKAVAEEPFAPGAEVETGAIAETTEAPQTEVATASQEQTYGASPVVAAAPPAPAPPARVSVAPVPPTEGGLLPSAQNWMEQNAPAETSPPPAPPKAKPAEVAADARITDAVGKTKPKPEAVAKSEMATAPKPQPKKDEVAPFKTAVVKAPQEQLFAPVLLELKNAESLMRVFEDLQRRHSALAGKRAELRPAAGPNNETWFALLAVPAVSKAEAEAICRAMGTEGATLRCRTTKY